MSQPTIQIADKTYTPQQALAQAQNYLAAGEHAAAGSLALKAYEHLKQEPQIYALLADVSYHQGDLMQAYKLMLNAFNLAPTNAEYARKTGQILTQGSKKDNKLLAIKFFEKSLELQPNQAESHYALGVLYRGFEKFDEAKTHYQKACDLDPENQKLARHHLAALQGEALEQADAAYIAENFNRFANVFEHKLQQDLKYDIPQKLINAWCQLANPTEKSLQIADLGCGTGLIGQHVAPYAQTLIGVDLAEKMLAKAAEKNIYTALEKTDIVSFLKNKTQQFDALIAADVTVYIGNLQPLFSHAAQALKPKGWLLFSTEDTAGESYHLKPSGRFGHARSYIEELASQNNFKIKKIEQTQIRFELEKSITGDIVILQKN